MDFFPRPRRKSQEERGEDLFSRPYAEKSATRGRIHAGQAKERTFRKKILRSVDKLGRRGMKRLENACGFSFRVRLSSNTQLNFEARR